MDLSAVEKAIDVRFKNLSRVGRNKSVIRCERYHKKHLLALFYFDLSERIIDRAFNLEAYQEDLLAIDFYEHKGPLQWSFYLVFLVGKENYSKISGERRISAISHDKSFARKYVLSEDQLPHFVEAVTSIEAPSAVAVEDLVLKWKTHLDSCGLSDVYTRAPRTTVIAKVADGIEQRPAEETESPHRYPERSLQMIQALTIEEYRNRASGRHQLKQVNLLSGPNGSGKTSFLEGIELCLCGQTLSNGTEPGAELSIEYSDGSTDAYEEGNNAKYRRLDKVMYGRTYRSGNKMAEAFARYNFLATDAAYHLAFSDTPEEIGKAFTDFILGEEATFIDQRLVKFEEDLSQHCEQLKRAIRDGQSDVMRLTKEIKGFEETLRCSPEEEREALDLVLSRVPLKEKPSPEDVDFRELRQQLVGPATIVDSLRNDLDWLHPLTVAALATELGRVRQTSSRVPGLVESIEKLARDQASAERQLAESRKSHTLLDQAERLVRIPRIDRAPWLRSRLGKLHRSVKHIENGRKLLDIANELAYGKICPAPIGSILEEEAALSKEELRSLDGKIRDIESSIGEAKSLLTSLRKLGLDYMAATSRTTECPLCGHKHPEGHLMELLSSTDLSFADGGSLRELLEKRNGLASKVVRTSSLLVLTSRIEQWASESGNAVPTGIDTLSDLHGWLSKCLSTVEAGISELDTLERLDRDLAEADIDPQEVASLAEQVLEKHGIELTESASEAIAAESEALADKIVQSQAKIAYLDEEVARSREFLRDLLSDVLTGLYETDYMLTLLSKRLRGLETAQENISDVSKLLKLEADTDLQQLAEALNLAIRQLDEMIVLRNKVRESSTLLTERRKALSEANYRISSLGPKLENLKRACGAIAEIRERDGIDHHLKDFVEAYKQSILRIFARINQPAEFCNLFLGDDDDDKIRLERHDGSLAGLSQISTGQRSALALSIFLALNRSAAEKMDLILIDDPVANIDDLNSLAFLDYLRNAALGGSQILFATADEKLANLFRMKFAFLGPEAFQRIDFSAEDPLQRLNRPSGR